MQTIKDLRARIEKASARMEAAQSKILTPGDYEFVVVEAKEEHDEVRKYDYWYVRLNADDQITTDRFPLTDQMFWKLSGFLESIGLELESLKDVRDLVGRSGSFIAKKKDDWTVYEYQRSIR